MATAPTTPTGITSILSQLPTGISGQPGYSGALSSLFSGALGPQYQGMIQDQLGMTPAAVGASQAATANEQQRQTNLTGAQTSINSAFDGLAATMPGQVQQAYMNTNMPLVDNTWSQNRAQMIYGMARGGNDKSSAAATGLGDTLFGYNQARQGVANDAMTAAQNTADQINKARSSTVNASYGAYNPMAAADTATAGLNASTKPAQISQLGTILNSLMGQAGTAAQAKGQGYGNAYNVFLPTAVA